MRYLVTRHRGAREWCLQQGYQVDQQLPHLTPDIIQPGDLVIGILPLPMAAQIQQNGARYLHLSLDVPEALRGKELDSATMACLGAKLQEFRIQAI
ncbi:CRISPR-associated protein Csx16 [Vibrio cholerae]